MNEWVASGQDSWVPQLEIWPQRPRYFAATLPCTAQRGGGWKSQGVLHLWEWHMWGVTKSEWGWHFPVVVTHQWGGGVERAKVSSSLNHGLLHKKKNLYTSAFSKAVKLLRVQRKDHHSSKIQNEKNCSQAGIQKKGGEGGKGWTFLKTTEEWVYWLQSGSWLGQPTSWHCWFAFKHDFRLWGLNPKTMQGSEIFGGGRPCCAKSIYGRST